MQVLSYILWFFLITTAVGVLYACIAVNRNKNEEIYDDKWIGSLKLVEYYNQAERKEIFKCENHYEHQQAVMELIVYHKRPPHEAEAQWDGKLRHFERAKVIELEGRYFWQQLG